MQSYVHICYKQLTTRYKIGFEKITLFLLFKMYDGLYRPYRPMLTQHIA